jgi:hypothetical protein
MTADPARRMSIHGWPSTTHGAFTEQLLLVWDHAKYRGNYARFYASIKARMPAAQTPNLFSMATWRRSSRRSRSASRYGGLFPRRVAFDQRKQ